MDKKKLKSRLKKVWHFIWEEDSIWSWLVNVILAFVLIKFLVYPGLGLALQTDYPVVAVVSESMEHDGNFDKWWDGKKEWYITKGISKEEFSDFRFKNGFNKGDIMVLFGKKTENIANGDVIVFRSKRPDPIIHRVVDKWNENKAVYFQTKGDHNLDSIKSYSLDETKIRQDDVIGVAVLRVPFLGYVKIYFVELLKLLRILK